MIKTNMRLLFSLILLAMLVGCANEYQIEPFDFKAEYDKISKTKTTETKTKEINISDIAQRKSNYRYSAVGKKDPFRSYFGDMAAMNKEKKIVSELQNFDVSDLRLTAIVWGISEPRATIVAPDGKSYIVKTGSFIGKNWGKISRILPDKIEIVETYKDPLGRKIINKLYLELPVKTNLTKDEDDETESAADFESENSGANKKKSNNNNN
ncbi:pilus assembly protein PilP [bacterium]|nr:pilus assembly protein PilP [bacterium]